MLMKIHSYVSINGSFSQVYVRKQAEERKLKALVDTLPGGWQKAQLDASEASKKSRQEESKSTTPDASELETTGTQTPSGTPAPIQNGVTLGTQPLDQVLRNRLAAAPARTKLSNGVTVSVENGTPASVSRQQDQQTTASYFPSSDSKEFPPQTIDNDPSVPSERHPLVGHPDPRINDLACTIRDLDDELTSTGINGKGKVRFPENITLWNFVDYQLIPTLVYELEYPRTDKYVNVLLPRQSIDFYPQSSDILCF